jgi:hypothetical protein
MDEKTGLKVSTDTRPGAQSVKSGAQAKVVSELPDLDVGKAALLEKRLVASGSSHSDVAFDLLQDHLALTELLDEVVSIRRVQIERPLRLQRAMDGSEDPNELVVVDVFGKVEREGRVELAGMAFTEFDEVGALERALADASRVPAAFGRPDEFLREIDADIIPDAWCDQFKEDAVATPEVRDDLRAGQLKERQHPAHPLHRVRVVLIDVASIVDRAKLLVRETVSRAVGRHTEMIWFVRPSAKKARLPDPRSDR